MTNEERDKQLKSEYNKAWYDVHRRKTDRVYKKITERDIQYLRENAHNYTLAAISRILRAKPSSVKYHITKEGLSCKPEKYTEEVSIEILNMYNNGAPMSEIRDKYNTGKSVYHTVVRLSRKYGIPISRRENKKRRRNEMQM